MRPKLETGRRNALREQRYESEYWEGDHVRHANGAGSGRRPDREADVQRQAELVRGELLRLGLLAVCPGCGDTVANERTARRAHERRCGKAVSA